MHKDIEDLIRTLIGQWLRDNKIENVIAIAVYQITQDDLWHLTYAIDIRIDKANWKSYQGDIYNPETEVAWIKELRNYIGVDRFEYP